MLEEKITEHTVTSTQRHQAAIQEDVVDIGEGHSHSKEQRHVKQGEERPRRGSADKGPEGFTGL